MCLPRLSGDRRAGIRGGCCLEQPPRIRERNRPLHLASGRLGLQHTAANLVLLDRFEERLEVSLPEPIVSLALDELEEDRADRGLPEALEQHLRETALYDALAVDEDAVLLQAIDR